MAPPLQRERAQPFTHDRAEGGRGWGIQKKKQLDWKTLNRDVTRLDNHLNVGQTLNE